MPNRSRQKGDRAELWTMKWFKSLFESYGLKFKVKKVGGSGAFPGWPGDLYIYNPYRDGGEQLIVEVKTRSLKKKDCKVVLDDWLGNNDLLVIKIDYEKDPYILIPGMIFERFIEAIAIERDKVKEIMPECLDTKKS